MNILFVENAVVIYVCMYIFVCDTKLIAHFKRTKIECSQISNGPSHRAKVIFWFNESHYLE